MTFRQQIFKAINTRNIDALQHLLASEGLNNPIIVVLALRQVCESKSIEYVKALLPYTADYFKQPSFPEDPATGKSMSLKPCEMLYQLLYDTVVPSNNAQMFGLFKNLLTSEHMRQCPVILVQCFELGHVDLIDCLLPFVDDLSAVARYKPQAYAFFEERKNIYQNHLLMNEISNAPMVSVARKI